MIQYFHHDVKPAYGACPEPVVVSAKSNKLIPRLSRALDFQADQLPATGTADIHAFDLHGTYGLRKIRGFTLNTDLIPHGKVPLGHFYDGHLDL